MNRSWGLHCHGHALEDTELSQQLVLPFISSAVTRFAYSLTEFSSNCSITDCSHPGCRNGSVGNEVLCQAWHLDLDQHAGRREQASESAPLTCTTCINIYVNKYM